MRRTGHRARVDSSVATGASARGAADGEDRWSTAWALGLVLFLALGLRLWGLWAFPLEQDELYTIVEATRLFDNPLEPGIEARPLYYLLQHALFRVLPDTAPALRLLPLLFGVAGVWATWRLGREAAGRVAGLSAAFLVAVSPWHLYASGMARYWSLVYLLAALAYAGLLRAYRTDRGRDYAAAVVPLALGALTHPSFLFPLPGVALALSLVRDDGGWGWRWPTRRAFLWLWVPFVAVLAAGFVALRLTGNSGSLQNWSGRGALATLRLVPAMVQWTTPVVFAAGAVGAVASMWHGRGRTRYGAAAGGSGPSRRRWGTSAALGGGVTVAALVAASAGTDVYADYGMAALPLAVVSAGVLVQAGAERMRSGGRAFAVAAVVVLAAGVLPSTISHLSDGTRFDYRPAFREIMREGASTPVLTSPIAVQRRYAPELDGRPLVREPARLDSLLRAERRFWVVAPVRRYGIVGDPAGELEEWLSAHCRLRRVDEGLRLDYRRYRVELHRCGASPP